MRPVIAFEIILKIRKHKECIKNEEHDLARSCYGMKDPKNTEKEMAEIVIRIAKNIREQRLARGLKQTDMGQFGFGYRWYQRLESGRHVPTLPTLVKLARALEIELSELLR